MLHRSEGICSFERDLLWVNFGDSGVRVDLRDAAGESRRPIVGSADSTGRPDLTPLRVISREGETLRPISQDSFEFTDGGFWLSLGLFELDPGQEHGIEIYADGPTAGQAIVADGARFRLATEVVPEPTTGALLAAGSALLLRRRRSA